MATSAPARANSIAIDLLMPVPPPVMIAALPSRENGFLAMAGTIPQNIDGRHGSAGIPEKRPGSAGALRTLGAWGPFPGPHVYGKAISDWRWGTSRSMRRHTPIEEKEAP